MDFSALSPFGVEAVGFKIADMACEDADVLKRAIASNGFITLRKQQANDAASRIYRHRWQLGDIVVWDNRCTMHRADHSNVIGDRVLHRGLVSGGIPLGLQD